LKGDSIIIEFFYETTENPLVWRIERKIITGIVQYNKITFNDNDRNGDSFLKAEHEVFFKKFGIRPEPVFNWIREKRKIRKSGLSITFGK
jgi:hypothetical protein